MGLLLKGSSPKRMGRPVFLARLGDDKTGDTQQQPRLRSCDFLRDNFPGTTCRDTTSTKPQPGRERTAEAMRSKYGEEGRPSAFTTLYLIVCVPNARMWKICQGRRHGVVGELNFGLQRWHATQVPDSALAAPFSIQFSMLIS